jgi:hypothetical protein
MEMCFFIVSPLDLLHLVLVVAKASGYIDANLFFKVGP